MKRFQVLIPIILCLAVGSIGSYFTVPSIPTWYATLVKPSFSPPNFIFAPVWTTLYILMGISVYLVWSEGINKRAVKVAVGIFVVQLFLNLLWSVFFFGLRSPSLALAGIVILWIAILLTMIKFYKISKPAMYLLIPYLSWVSFATILNLFIVLLN